MAAHSHKFIVRQFALFQVYLSPGIRQGVEYTSAVDEVVSGEHPLTGQAASDMCSRMLPEASVALAFVSAADKKDAIKNFRIKMDQI